MSVKVSIFGGNSMLFQDKKKDYYNNLYLFTGRNVNHKLAMK